MRWELHDDSELRECCDAFGLATADGSPFTAVSGGIDRAGMLEALGARSLAQHVLDRASTALSDAPAGRGGIGHLKAAVARAASAASERRGRKRAAPVSSEAVQNPAAKRGGSAAASADDGGASGGGGGEQDGDAEASPNPIQHGHPSTGFDNAVDPDGSIEMLGPSKEVTRLQVMDSSFHTGWGSESVRTTPDERSWTASAGHQIKQDLLRDPAFIRHIFCEVNKLRVASKRTKKLRAEEHAGLPSFDDFDGAGAAVWMGHAAGAALSFGRVAPSASTPGMNLSLHTLIPGEVCVDGSPRMSCSWCCRLNPDFTLKTGVSSWKVLARQCASSFF